MGTGLPTTVMIVDNRQLWQETGLGAAAELPAVHPVSARLAEAVRNEFAAQSPTPAVRLLRPGLSGPTPPDHLLCIEGSGAGVVDVARRARRTVLHLQTWLGEDCVWSELLEIDPEGRSTRLIGAASMLKAHRPGESLDQARTRTLGFVGRWLARLPDRLPPEAAGGPPPVRASDGVLGLRALIATGTKAIERLTRRQQWGLVIDRPTSVLAPVDFRRARTFFPPRDRFWADPFPVQRDGRTYVFFEELPFATQRGHLSVAELLPDGGLGAPETILTRPYHLSYPNVFAWQGEWYLVPECSENERLEIYRCERWPDRWTLAAEDLVGRRLADPTFIEHEGRWWMFATATARVPSLDDELHLFHADSPLGPWTPHVANPVIDDARWARPAGRLLRQDGRLLRPAQNCRSEYGQSLSVREVLELNPERYREREFVHLHGDPSAGMKRLHTLNLADEFRVLDAMRLA